MTYRFASIDSNELQRRPQQSSRFLRDRPWIAAHRKIRCRSCFLFLATLALLLPGNASRDGLPSRAWAQDAGDTTPEGAAGVERAPLSPDLEKQMDLIRARILSRQGRIPESLALYRELRSRYSDDKEIWIDFIETLVNEGFYEAAELELNAFLDRYPGDQRALRIQARVFFEQGRFASTYPVYDRLLEIFSEDAGIWSDYGYARQGDGDWAGALDCFSRALELDPENKDTLQSAHGILREHSPRVDAGYRIYRQEESDAEWATAFLRHERHLTDATWWTFAYDRVRMDRPKQPFLPAVSETLNHASLRVAYTVNRFFTGRAGAGLFSGVGGGTSLFLGLEARPHPDLVLRADYAHNRPWYDPLEAVAEEGREHQGLLTAEWTGWNPWTLYMEAEQSDYEVRDLSDYGRQRGILAMLSRRFGDNPLLLLSYTHARKRFEYASETFRPVLLIEREVVHGVSALFEHRPCTYWTYRLSGGIQRDTARDLDSWYVRPEAVVRMGNRVEARFAFEHSSEAGTVTGGTTRTVEAGVRILF
jgi:tetratricopeptide (TPR) repeat protein